MAREPINPDESGVKGKTFDLTNLILSEGTHNITVKARAVGFIDSEPSNVVSYEVKVDTVTVSGTWHFNEKVSNGRYYAEVSFTSNGQQFSSISALDIDGYIMYDAVVVSDYVNKNDPKWTMIEAYRTITFNGVQTVPKKFYNWLVENAQRPIQGTYVLDDGTILNYPGVYPVSFVSNGIRFNGINMISDRSVGYQYMYYYDSDGNETLVAQHYWSVDEVAQFVDEAYRTMAFEGVQYVSNDLYNWLMCNDAQQTILISGTWYFNDIPKYATNDIFQSCNFTTEEGDEYNGFKVFTAGSVVVEFGTGYGEKGTGYEIDFGWTNNSLRTITFDGVQTVSKKFYDWLVINAKIAINGTWLFNEVIDTYKDYEYVSFVSGTTTYDRFDGFARNGWILYGTTWVYDNSTDKWENTIYRTITFDGTQYVSKQFYEYMKNNAVFAFTIDGTTYYAKEGMTWGEWIESEYNTGGYTIWLQYITQHGNNDSIIVGETTTSLIIANTAYRMSSGSPENPGEKG